MKQKKKFFTYGLRDGVPIGLGYFAVAFTLGIAAKKIGLSGAQATAMSLTNLTSAGEFAALGIISAGASYGEMALTQLIINLRYCLMSCSLSQKIDPAAGIGHRLLVAFGVTDEIFGVSAGTKGRLSPFYSYGIMSVAVPGWTLGTLAGVVSGGMLPGRVLSALSVALYAMFIAVIIPPCRESRVVAGLICISMAASTAVTYLPVVKNISSGMRIILLTVVIAGAAALLFPIKEEKEEEENREA